MEFAVARQFEPVHVYEAFKGPANENGELALAESTVHSGG